jgi:hypothetical protein
LQPESIDFARESRAHSYARRSLELPSGFLHRPRAEFRGSRLVFFFFLIGFLLILLIIKLALADYSIEVST